MLVGSVENHRARKALTLLHFPIGQRIYSTDFGFREGNRRINFLMGGDIKKNDILFVVEDDISDFYHQELHIRVLNHVHLKGCMAYVTPVDICKSLKYLLKGPKWVYRYLLWAGFFRRFSIDKYVVYNDLPRENEVRTRMMQEKGIPVYWFSHSMNNWHEFARFEGVKEPETADVYCDEVMCWNMRQVEWWTFQTDEINCFHVTGCPWSEIIKEIRVGRKPGRVVAAFSTSIGPTCTEEDEKQFYHDIYGLEMDECIGGITYVRSKTKGDGQDPLMMVAGADLVIGYPFSSIVIEALQAGVPAIFYDPTGRWKPSHYPIDLYAKNPSELLVRVKQILDDPDGFMKVVRGYSEYGPWDGKGLTRIRELLKWVQQEELIYESSLDMRYQPYSSGEM